MPMTRLLAGLALLGLLFGAGGCGDDEESSPTRVTTYTLTLINNTSTEYEVWIDADVDADGFVQNGAIAGNTSRELTRTVGIVYQIRFVLDGQDPETDFAYETMVSSNGADREFSFGP